MADYDEIKGSLENLSKQELERLVKDVDRALRSVDERARREARRKAQEAAQEYGFSLTELLEGDAKGSRKRQTVPKYRHPENPDLTWSGRGRQPGWIKEHIGAGRDVEELRIQGETA